MSYTFLQHYWWFLISLLGALLVFLLFVQGANTLIFELGKTPDERRLVINSTGRKWEFTFTTLVTFGGAFFAAFPLFYSTSFGGAYWLWSTALWVRCSSVELLPPSSTAVTSSWTKPMSRHSRSPSSVTGPMPRAALTPSSTRGMWCSAWPYSVWCASSAFSTCATTSTIRRCVSAAVASCCPTRSPSLCSSSPFSCKYLSNLLTLWPLAIVLLIGVAALLYGILRTWLKADYASGIWPAGIGTVLVVLVLFLIAGWNTTAYYPSNADLQSSLTIVNSSSSLFTLKTMFYVSLLIPFVLAYIAYCWHAMDHKKLTVEEVKDEESEAY